MDHDNDGFICLQDQFNWLRTLNDQDQVIREDLNKLSNLLKRKRLWLKKTKKLSPIIFGIYDKEENEENGGNENLVFNEFIADDNEVIDTLLIQNEKPSIVGMVWDYGQHRIVPVKNAQQQMLFEAIKQQFAGPLKIEVEEAPYQAILN